MRFKILSIFILFVLFLLFENNVGYSQTTLPDTENLPKKAEKTRFNIYYHLGSVELPEGYKGYYTEGFTDAWFGWIESPDKSLKINWAAGIVESLFEKYKSSLVWTKDETNSDYDIKIALINDKKKESLLAKVGDIQFFASINQESDKENFMKIIRSYQKKKCESCRSFRFKSRD